MTDKLPYTHDTVLMEGTYKFTRLGHVPPDYLLNLLKSGCTHNLLLRDYLKNNISHIMARKSGLLQTPPIRPICAKVAYASEKDAKSAIKKICSSSDGRKKPTRCYECKMCSYWHLTSVTLKQWEGKIGVNSKKK